MGNPAIESIDLKGLSVEERLHLIEVIWDSLATEEESIGVTEAQKEELDRRIAAYKASPTQGSTWEEVEARLRGKA